MRTNLLYLTIISMFFPIPLQVMGKDAVTTGTIFISILFASYVGQCIKNKQFFYDKIDAAVIALMAIAVISTVNAINDNVVEPDMMGHAIRQLVSFVSSLILFMVIKNIGKLKGYENAEPSSVSDIAKILIYLLSIHVMITLVITIYPPSENLFAIFYSRNSEDALDVTYEILRARSFVFSAEQYGEILAAMGPFIVYMIYTEKKIVWYICLFIFCVGLTLSVTRSGIILFLIGTLTSYVYMNRKSLPCIMISSVVTAVGFYAIMLTRPAVFSNVFIRFDDAADKFASSDANVFEIINRDNFPDFWAQVVSNISFTGQSLARVDFHNLFMTSLYQIGVLGTILLFFLILYPFWIVHSRGQIRNSDNHGKFIFVCIMFISMFMMNELKFEFTRTASYQQICMSIIGMIYLATSSFKRNRI